MFFTNAIKKHKLKFKKLSEYNENKEEYLKLTASWAKKSWGYLEKDAKEFYLREIHENQDHIYIGTFHNQPVAMFGLFEKKFAPLQEKHLNEKSSHKELKFVYFDYVYVEERFRGLGFARQLLNQAKTLAIEWGADSIYMDTLNPKLNNMYIKYGAKIICEGQHHENPTDVLSISL